ncbi:tRNA pseudouridine(65) synthase TruC [Photobacterium japonica]|uniref:tRNA pseudouridine(65) synthase TruC n=1 Tax=Photobacterium japonica TaxID=2910235 RepID=UPI003D0A4BC8
MNRNRHCQQLLLQLEAVMQAHDLWETTSPDRAALQSVEPFAIDTLTCTQWLQWVFIPKLGQLLQAQLPLPEALEISPYVEEAMKGLASSQPLVMVTREIDQLFSHKPIELEILYRDEYLVAVNKPAGMLVHRSWLDSHETVFVMQTLRDQIGQHVFPLHRLDRPTSGVLLFGLSKEIAALMMPKFAGRDIKKTYHAVVRGWVKEAAVLDYPLKQELDKIADKHADQEKEAQPAVTAYAPIAKVETNIPVGRYATSRYTLVEMQPETGRKHQLRRHMHHLSHHIIGDVNHGDGRHNRMFRENFACHRLMLHASRLQLAHPITEAVLDIRASVDDTWQHVMTAFEWDAALLTPAEAES